MLEKIFIFILFFLFVGCSSEKSPHRDIDLQNYLPNGKTGTIYISQFTKTGMHKIEEHKALLERQEDCVHYRVTLIKDKKKESEYIDNLCATKHLLYRGLSKEEPLINTMQKSWVSMRMVSRNQIDKMKCGIVSYKPYLFKGKKVNAITTECRAKNSTLFITFAENLGIVEIEQKVEGFGNIGGIKLNKIVRK